MKFTIGPWTYRVVIVKDLKDSDGARAQGVCDGIERIISIDADANPENRVAVLFHELRHTWQFEFGYTQTRDMEDDCNFTASFAVDTYRQFMRQGGKAALSRLRCSEIEPPVRHYACRGRKAAASLPPRRSLRRSPDRYPPVGAFLCA